MTGAPWVPLGYCSTVVNPITHASAKNVRGALGTLVGNTAVWGRKGFPVGLLIQTECSGKGSVKIWNCYTKGGEEDANVSPGLHHQKRQPVQGTPGRGRPGVWMSNHNGCVDTPGWVVLKHPEASKASILLQTGEPGVNQLEVGVIGR